MKQKKLVWFKIVRTSAFRMKQEPLVWKHFDQLVLHDLENAKNAKQKRQIIKCALGLEKRDWNNKGTLKPNSKCPKSTHDI